MPSALSRSPRTAVVWDVLRRVAAERRARDTEGEGDAPGAGGGGDAPEPAGAPAALDVLDVGGGTGGFAVPLAELGHRVNVVDPNPDALAALQRRAVEAGVAVRAVQGDLAGLLDVVEPASADLVLCHGVLEHLESSGDLGPALAALVATLRPGGTLSLLVASRNAVVLARAVAGRFAEAQAALRDPDGRFGPGDPLPRRFTEPGLVALVEEAGLRVEALHGVRALADLVPGALLDSEPGAADALVALESAAANLPEFRAIATQLHVRAVKP